MSDARAKAMKWANDYEIREGEDYDWVEEYAKTNSAGCRYSKQMLLECFDMGFDDFFAKYLDLQEKATAADDFAEAMDAYREDRPPIWQ